jgi:Bacterial regulatory proteins, lacI family
MNKPANMNKPAPGSTLAHVAEQAGVSQATASGVLNGGTVSSVQSAGTALSGGGRLPEATAKETSMSENMPTGNDAGDDYRGATDPSQSGDEDVESKVAPSDDVKGNPGVQHQLGSDSAQSRGESELGAHDPAQ